MFAKGSPSTKAGEIGASAIDCNGDTNALSFPILSISVLEKLKFIPAENLSVSL